MDTTVTCFLLHKNKEIHQVSFSVCTGLDDTNDNNSDRQLMVWYIMTISNHLVLLFLNEEKNYDITSF